MPVSGKQEKKTYQFCKYLSLAVLGAALSGCGGSSNTPPTPEPVKETPESNKLQPNEVLMKLALSMQNVNIKLYDNSTNQVVTELESFTGSSSALKFPIERINQIYRLEITTNSNSRVYDFINDKYVPFTGTYHALIWPTSTEARVFLISPVSEAIYQRALIRAGQLPDEAVDNTRIQDLHFKMATNDVNAALLDAFKNVDMPSLSQPITLTSLEYGPQKSSLYMETYLSFGYLMYWYENHNQNNTYADFTLNLAQDLKDGYLDGRPVPGDTQPFTAMVSSVPNNIDPQLNTALDIGANQKNTRDEFAGKLKNAVLDLALIQLQQNLNPSAYKALSTRTYSGQPDSNNSNNVRTYGAGDYRRAFGFTGSTATCHESTYPCRQGLIGINTESTSLPTIEYLVGRYKADDCVLKIRATGGIELSKGDQVFKSTLDADGTDNLLQVSASGYEYLLNSSSAEPSNTTQQYPFIQLHIKANKIRSATAGYDHRKAPSQLENPQLSCNFS